MNRWSPLLCKLILLITPKHNVCYFPQVNCVNKVCFDSWFNLWMNGHKSNMVNSFLLTRPGVVLLAASHNTQYCNKLNSFNYLYTGIPVCLSVWLTSCLYHRQKVLTLLIMMFSFRLSNPQVFLIIFLTSLSGFTLNVQLGQIITIICGLM